MNITNDIITAFINTFYKNENKDLQELRAFAEAQHVPIILRDTEGLLLNLLRIKKPKKDPGDRGSCRVLRMLFCRRLRLPGGDHRIQPAGL